MDKEQIINKLRELGINSNNCYPKKTFLDSSGEVVIGMHKKEFSEDFYFYVEYDKKLYVLRKQIDLSKFPEDIFMGKTKYLVPVTLCQLVWEDKPLEEIELPDKKFQEMTVREYACIHLKVPNSGIPWLDKLIEQGQQHDMKIQNMV